MVAIKCHFNGKVLIPDEPLNLPTNQPLVAHLEPVTQEPHPITSDFNTWLGAANRGPENPNPRFESDDDLWE